MQRAGRRRYAGRGGLEDELAANAAGVERLIGLLDLLPDLDVILSGIGVIARRTGQVSSGLMFKLNGPGTLNHLEVLFRDKSIYTVAIGPLEMSAGDSVTIEGNAPGNIADMMYELIERGALLNDRQTIREG